MKVLGQPQVRPEMVFALLRLLEANGGELKGEEAFALMGPSVACDAASPVAKKTMELIQDTAEVARSLGFVKEKVWELTRPAPANQNEFGHALHDALLATREWDVIDTYASLIVEIELKGVGWMAELSQENIAKRLGDRVQIPASGAPRETAVINSSRWAAWRSWATAAGLGVPGLTEAGGFFPNPVRLVERVARKHPGLRSGREITAPEFLDAIGKELPYLDGGKRAAVAWQRAGDAPRAGITFVLSTSLRELSNRKVLQLLFAGGDRAGARRLYDDGSEVKAFATVRLEQGDV